jgi:hypothetical protein
MRHIVLPTTCKTKNIVGLHGSATKMGASEMEQPEKWGSMLTKTEANKISAHPMLNLLYDYLLSVGTQEKSLHGGIYQALHLSSGESGSSWPSIVTALFLWNSMRS